MKTLVQFKSGNLQALDVNDNITVKNFLTLCEKIDKSGIVSVNRMYIGKNQENGVSIYNRPILENCFS